MSSKKNATTARHQPAGAEDRQPRALHRRRRHGRITWANGVSVKIQWDDGEQVTWRRDSLAGRPLEILDADDGRSRPNTHRRDRAAEPASRAETTAPNRRPTAAARAADERPTPTDATPAPQATRADSGAQPCASPGAPTTRRRDAAEPTDTRQAQAPAQGEDAGRAEGEEAVSALDAAARVLAEAGQAMTCKEMIGDDGRQGLLDQPRRQDARRHALLRHPARDQRQGRAVPLRQGGTRPVRLRGPRPDGPPSHEPTNTRKDHDHD